jgi:hypothetical protein
MANAIVVNGSATQLRVISGTAMESRMIPELNRPRPIEGAAFKL